MSDLTFYKNKIKYGINTVKTVGKNNEQKQYFVEYDGKRCYGEFETTDVKELIRMTTSIMLTFGERLGKFIFESVIEDMSKYNKYEEDN